MAERDDILIDIEFNLDIADAIRDASRFEDEMMGISRATKEAMSAEERYAERLQQRKRALFEAEKMKPELTAFKAGLAPTVSYEQQYQKELDKTIEKLERKKRLEGDLISRGLKADPDIQKFERQSLALARQVEQREKDERREEQRSHDRMEKQRERAETRRKEAEKKIWGDPDHKGIAVGMALAQGNFLHAAVTQALGTGQAANFTNAALTGAGKAFSFAGNVADIRGNSFLTAGEQDRALIKALPGGENIQDNLDKLSGRTNFMRKFYGQTIPHQQIEIAGRLKQFGIQAEYGSQVASHQNTANALGRFSAQAVSEGHDRFSVAGKYAFELEERALNFTNQRRKAELEITAARKTQAQETERLGQIDAKIAGLRNTAGASGGDYQQRAKFLGGKAGFEQELEGLLNERNTQIGRVQHAATTTAESESAYRRIGIEEQKDKLSILQEKEQRTLSTGERLGRMSRASRQQGLQAALLLKRRGRAGVTDEIFNIASQFDPQLASLEAQKAGINSPEYQKYAEAGGFPDQFKNLQELQAGRAQIGEAKAEITVNVALNEAKLAGEIAKALSVAMKGFIDTVNASVKNQKNKVDTGILQKNNQQ